MGWLKEIDGCIGSGRCGICQFKAGRLSIKEVYTSIIFVRGVELYVCMYLIFYVLMRSGCVLLVSHIIKISSTYRV